MYLTNPTEITIMSNTLKEIKTLEKTLDHADHMYHTFGTSDLSDAEYDALKDRLKVLDPTNKRFKKVGSSVKKVSHKKDTDEHWEKYTHVDFKMGSQNKVTTDEALDKWAAKIPGIETDSYIVQHKLDGTSIKLVYNEGKLTFAATRGDGNLGENILRNALLMKGVPKEIPLKAREVVLRGEILLYKSNLSHIGGKNTRNSAAGTAKRLDGEGCEHLNVRIYGIMNWKDLTIMTEEESMLTVKNCGFDPVKSYTCKTLADVKKIMAEYIQTKRSKLDWDIDGLVVKTNVIDSDAWDYPDRSIAYKFPSEEAVTKLVDVAWRDTGGRISPTAVLEPVDINGVTVSAATLNNLDHIEKLGIKIGDLVVVSRRNDVIPCIERVSISDKHGKLIKPPTHDDEGFPIVREKNINGEELAYLVSTNPNSLSKRRRQIISWYKAHDAKGLGEETIVSIMEAGIAKDLPEFYEVGLHGHDDLINVEGFGAGKFKILNKATLLTSKTTLLKFLDGMDLQGFSLSRFEAILEHFNKEKTLDELLTLCHDVDLIASIPGFGENTAKSLKKSLEENESIITKMKNKVEIESWTPQKVSAHSKINGLSFCFTGSMVHDRSVLEKAVKKHGGVVAGVSKNLDILVVSSLSWTSGKVEKAEKLGIKKIVEDEFLKLIDSDI